MLDDFHVREIGFAIRKLPVLGSEKMIPGPILLWFQQKKPHAGAAE
jgi:hypothetical protein